MQTLSKQELHKWLKQLVIRQLEDRDVEEALEMVVESTL